MAEQIQGYLAAIAASEDLQDASWGNHLLESPVFEQLLSFIASNRFRGDPRQLANAMAGLPRVGWWRSLKISGGNPCRKRIGERALKDYLRRKHPRLFSELEGCQNDLIGITNALRRYRSKDQEIVSLKRDAESVRRIMNETSIQLEPLAWPPPVDTEPEIQV